MLSSLAHHELKEGSVIIALYISVSRLIRLSRGVHRVSNTRLHAAVQWYLPRMVHENVPQSGVLGRPPDEYHSHEGGARNLY